MQPGAEFAQFVLVVLGDLRHSLFALRLQLGQSLFVVLLHLLTPALQLLELLVLHHQFVVVRRFCTVQHAIRKVTSRDVLLFGVARRPNGQGVGLLIKQDAGSTPGRPDFGQQLWANRSHKRARAYSCHQAVYLGIGLMAVTDCSWEGSCKSGVTLAVRHPPTSS